MTVISGVHLRRHEDSEDHENPKEIVTVTAKGSCNQWRHLRHSVQRKNKNKTKMERATHGEKEWKIGET